MLALSIKQPWAWAIFHGKNVENRTWRTTRRERIYIHASKLAPRREIELFLEIAKKVHLEIPDVRALPRQALIGQVDLTDCVPYEKSLGPWAQGPYCLILSRPELLEPISMPGRLWFWNPELESDAPRPDPAGL
jgi:hypothetical protein